jgi:alpha-glucosidase
MAIRSDASEAAPDKSESGLTWWQQGVIYQIYPLSFQDTDGDGCGDLPGILRRLEYLSWLGVDAVWLSPIYPSPMEDFGYDISDYTNVHPLFGTLDDLDRLTAELHERKIRLILDFVPNHTSSAHPWFLDSCSARTNPKRDWYIWCDPAPDGGPPNNWLSRFGDSAWELDGQTGQYYYHAFLKTQPDLNWRNPEVRRAMADILRFWMRRGVDGFRIDAAAVLAEDALLRDDPPNPDFCKDTPPPERFQRVYTDNRPECLRYLAELHAVTDKFPDRVLLGEVDTAEDQVAQFYGCDQRCLDLPLNYRLLDTSWDAASLRAVIGSYLDALPPHASPCWVIGSHDKPRIASRIGAAQARLAAMLLLTLPGTPILYAGDEIGMGDVPIPPDQALDPFEHRVPGYGLNRDPERAPMCWDSGPAAGFTSGDPWLPVGDNAERCAVSTLRRDEHSLLNLYRRLIAYRRTEPAILGRCWEPEPGHGDILAYWRCVGSRRIFVALNLGDQDEELVLGCAGEVSLSTHLDRPTEGLKGNARLRPHEGVIIATGQHRA